jgi:hypothetical protein
MKTNIFSRASLSLAILPFLVSALQAQFVPTAPRAVQADSQKVQGSTRKIGVGSLAPGTPVSFNFPMVWDDALANTLDVSSLNPAPISEKQRLSIKNGGKFYDKTGRRVRFVGVNITAGDAFPTNANADKIAAHLHKMGVNLVRFHHMDAPWATPNMFYVNGTPGAYYTAGQSTVPTSTVDPTSLARLDYFIDALKRNGIYSNLNLQVSREWTNANGFTEGATWASGKLMSYFHPLAITLQKQYARDLLTHTNPYTGTRLADDPAVAIVEMTNENSLFDGWWGNKSQLPASYQEILRQQWNVYLKQRYGNTATLSAAWTVSNFVNNGQFSGQSPWWTYNNPPAAFNLAIETPTGVAAPLGNTLHFSGIQAGSDVWHVQMGQSEVTWQAGQSYTVRFVAKSNGNRNIIVSNDRGSGSTPDYNSNGLYQTVPLTTGWQVFSYTFNATSTTSVTTNGRLTFNLGNQGTNDVYIADVSVTSSAGGNLLGGSESLESSTVALRGQTGDKAGVDFSKFLMDTEDRYVEAMRDLLKSEIGTRASITSSQSVFGGLAGLKRESGANTDFVDQHNYWQHPNFPGNAFDPSNYTIENYPLSGVSFGMGSLGGLTMYRANGKPFIVSEYDHPAPSEYAAEMIPMIFSYAAAQDWDGVVLFDAGNLVGNNRVTGFFDNTNHPSKLGLFPWAAAAFLRGDIKPSPALATLSLPDSEAARLKNTTDDYYHYYLAPGMNESYYFTHRNEVLFVNPTNTNLIPSGRFDGSTVDWIEEKLGVGSYTSSNESVTGQLNAPMGKAMHFSSIANGGVSTNVQFARPAISLESNKRYTVTFKARAGAARNLRVTAGYDLSPFTNYGLDSTVALGTGWQRYTLSFTAPTVITSHSRLSFVLGDATNDVYLADVTLREENGTSLGAPTLGFTGSVAATPALTWDRTTGIYRVNSPKSQALVGRIVAANLTAGRLTSTITSATNNFGVVTLTDMPRGGMLLTALSKSENQGLGWNAGRTFATNSWSTGPTQVYGLTGTITIAGAAGRTVYALSNTGARLATVSSTTSGSNLTFSISPAQQTMWYEIQ